VQVNHRYVRTTTPEAFDALVTELRHGRLDSNVPPHGTLIRVRRSEGLRSSRAEVAEQRIEAKAARDARIAKEQK
jgi:hypothetical protein